MSATLTRTGTESSINELKGKLCQLFLAFFWTDDALLGTTKE